MATPTTLPATFVAGNVLTAAQMNDLRGAFRILQVNSTTKIDTFSTTSATPVTPTGFEVSITPSSTSNKVLVVAYVNIGHSATNQAPQANLRRGTTNIFVPTVGTGGNATFNPRNIPSTLTAYAATMVFLDSPATTSATTYSVGLFTSGGTVYLNRTGFDDTWVSSSSITVMEVSA